MRLSDQLGVLAQGKAHAALDELPPGGPGEEALWPSSESDTLYRPTCLARAAQRLGSQARSRASRPRLRRCGSSGSRSPAWCRWCYGARSGCRARQASQQRPALRGLLFTHGNSWPAEFAHLPLQVLVDGPSNRLFCSALKRSGLAANFSRLSTAISWAILALMALMCLIWACCFGDSTRPSAKLFQARLDRSPGHCYCLLQP